MQLFRTCKDEDVNFNLDKLLIQFLSENAYYAELSRHIRKIPSKDLPTAAVAFDMHRDELTLYWNPEFMKSLTEAQVKGVLKHEFLHLTFLHISARRKQPPQMWNIATDLAINSLINNGNPNDTTHLPEFTLMPGRWFKHPDGREMTKDEKSAAPIASLIASMSQNQASEWYFSKLMETASQMKCPACGKKLMSSSGDKQDSSSGGNGDNQNQDPGDKQEGSGCNGDHEEGEGHSHGDGKNPCPVCGSIDEWINSWDDHGGWDQIPEDMREYVENRIKNVIEKATKHADQQANGWGDIPAEMRDAIRRSVSNIVNWRTVLRQFVGMLMRGASRNSIKKISRKYPYVHPGRTRGYTAKLLISIDQSGSVGDDMLETFFAELGSLTKMTSIDVLPFDCAANEKDIFSWKKGQRPDLKRVKCGGTDFDAPNAIVNDPKNRGRWDGHIVLTDGQAPQPTSSRIKRAWILGKGQKLYFNSDELQIHLDDQPIISGPWR